MRIGIMTFPNSPSYGASLQMHALYNVVKGLGCDVEIINYLNMHMKERLHFSSKKSLLKKARQAIFEAQSSYMFRRFENQLCMYPKKTINFKEQLSFLGSRYDYVICGSDQVWNPKITGTDFSYLLDFCERKEQRVAYAPSFGFSVMPDELRQDYTLLLKDFKALSIREQAGQQIIEELISEKAPVVVDPTFLLDKEYWESQVRTKKGLPKHYIASFIFNTDKGVSEFTQQLEKKHGLPVVYLSGHMFSRLKNKNCTGSMGPAEWMYVIKNADYVVTDSFHGTAFSIIFEKQFYASMLSVTNSRLVTLLNNFALDERAIQNSSGIDLNKKIDYSKVNPLILKKREASMIYLKEALGVV